MILFSYGFSLIVSNYHWTLFPLDSSGGLFRAAVLNMIIPFTFAFLEMCIYINIMNSRNWSRYFTKFIVIVIVFQGVIIWFHAMTA